MTKFRNIAILLFFCMPLVAQEAVLDVALVGDILMGTDFDEVKLPPDTGRLLFADCDSLLRSADLALANLEGPIASVGETKKKGSNSYAFQQPPYLAPRLAEAGFDFLALCNNHAMDMGEAGCAQTRHILDSLGIAYSGLLDTPPVVLLHDSLRIGICAFGQTSATPLHMDSALVAETVSELRMQCDILIVSFHGGAEGAKYSHVPDTMEMYLGEERGDLRFFTHLAIDCGADLIHGHGPHVSRAMELYRNRLICYSLGNFCTPFGINLAGINGLAPLVRVRLTKEGEFVDAQIYSFRQIRPYGPRWDANAGALREIQRLSAEDFPDSPLRFDDNGHVVCRRAQPVL